MNVLLSATAALNFLAQQQDTVEMADQLRADGKIWVVVLVIAVVFAGIVAYLVRLDRQLSNVEKEVRQNQQNTKHKTLDV
jgi:CcmD family protein